MQQHSMIQNNYQIVIYSKLSNLFVFVIAKYNIITVIDIVHQNIDTVTCVQLFTLIWCYKPTAFMKASGSSSIPLSSKAFGSSALVKPNKSTNSKESSNPIL